jgi:hypothetical protein
MTPPAWLAEFHRQWRRARGGRTGPAARGFRRSWETLLDDAGLTSAEDRQTAQREAAALPQLRLRPCKSKPRYIDQIELPPDSEPWLHALFGSPSGAELQAQALACVQARRRLEPPRLADRWQALLDALTAAFGEARSLGPFFWRDPATVAERLDLLHGLTARAWSPGTLIRDASLALGLDSKGLEQRQPTLERALELLFGRETPLEALGIQTRHSLLHFSGPLTLEFADGTRHETAALRFESTLPAAELERAVRITTTAERLLTVENRKTTFLQLARADAARRTLIVATSFPTQAVRLLLERLPVDLPHHHFGDTDPAGYDILRRLREIHPRPVTAFLMHWRDKSDSAPLSHQERQTLTRLLTDPRLHDCHPDLQALQQANRRGDFEQESLGPPDLQGWPFYGGSIIRKERSV